MKLSEIKFEDVQGMCMHYDEKDALSPVQVPESLERIKESLMSKFGDVEVVINPDADWFDKVRIVSDNWVAANKAFTAEKQAWCDKYGCD